ncbi:MAG: hypothetical protein L6461_23980 [Anaerolineae bacterium]|nr:hypothetical protein [Anaerolineae bacterium]
MHANYIDSSGVKMGLYPQANSGAAWTWQDNIIIPPNANLQDPFVLSGIIHETVHLQQPFFTRLSVYGELEAWQIDRNAYFEITGQFYGEPGATFHDPNYINQNNGNNRWNEISQLSLHSRTDLEAAQTLMIEISPGYQADKLPLQPIGDEIAYRLVSSVNQAVEKSIDSVKEIFDFLSP